MVIRKKFSDHHTLTGGGAYPNLLTERMRMGTDAVRLEDGKIVMVPDQFHTPGEDYLEGHQGTAIRYDHERNMYGCFRGGGWSGLTRQS